MIHPVWCFVLAAALAPIAGARGRRVFGLAGPAAAVALILQLPEGAVSAVSLAGLELSIMRVTAAGRLFALAFASFAFVAGLYAWREESAAFRVASLGLAAGGVGVALAGDLLALFVFWEWLSAASLALVWLGRSRRAAAAGTRYFYFHAAGGMCLLAGIVIHWASSGSLAIAPLDLGSGPAPWLILAGFATNAALPPLHAWLPDAYPEASPAGTVFLAAFTTKAAVYALSQTFAGADLLAWAGAAMALYGVVFAVLENDLRRLLGYHIISQVGYMVSGVGLGTALALDGAAAHAFSHIFYKGLLLMAAGAVIGATGRQKLSELGGVARLLPLTLLLYTIGAFSISGVPLFNGFVSKSMVVSAAAASGRGAIELMLLVASMGTFLHTGLKLPYFTFYARPYPGDPARVRPVPRSASAAMVLAATVCVATGLSPSSLYAMLPSGGADYHPYTTDHVVTALQLLLGTALAFWLLRRKLGGEATYTLDADRLYRTTVPAFVSALGASLERAGSAASIAARAITGAFPASWLANLGRPERWPVAAQVSLVVCGLAALLLLTASG